MLRASLAAIAIGYLPGALVYRLPWWERDRRAALPAEERAFWAVVISLVWSLAVVLTLAFFDHYRFERLLTADLALGVAALVAGGFRLRYAAGTAPRPTWSALVPAALIALGLWLFYPASEYIIGGKDPGTYLNEGVQIAQRGSLIVHDPVVASVPTEVRDIFFPAHLDQLSDYYSIRFQGFFVDDPARGIVIGQFPHLFPASIAIGYDLDGLSGARNATGAWAILGLVAVYLAGARLFGRTAAAAGVVLLAINVIEVWFARYPAAEIPMQALLFAALLAFGRATEGSRVFFGVIAAVLIGGLLFLRYDAILAIGISIAAASLLPVAGQRLGYAFVIVLVPLTTLGYFYLIGPMDAYSKYPLDFTRAQGGVLLIGGALAACVIAHRLFHIQAVAATVRRALPPVLATAIVACAIYAYFFREQGGKLAYHDAIAFRTLGWYLTPIGLAVAVVGLGWLIWKRFWRDPAFFLMLTTYAVFFSYKSRVVPEHFWAARRFLAVALPGAVLMMAGLASDVAQPIARRFPRWHALVAGVIIVGCLSPIAWLFWRQSAPVRHHVEYAGIIPHIEDLAKKIGERDLLLVESRDAGSDLHTLAVPLADIYARNVLVLSSAAPDKRALEDFVRWALTRYPAVWFLGGGGTDLLTRHLSAVPVSTSQFRVPEYASLMNAYPTAVRRKDFEYGLYRLGMDAGAPPWPITLKIGGSDDVQVARFYARERTGDTGMAFRWTTGQSFVVLPPIPAAARRLVIWMSAGGRPTQARPADVEIAVADRVVGTVRAAEALAPHAVDLPRDLVEAVAAGGDPFRIRLRVPTWRPQTLLGGPDDRDLGVMVTQIDVQ
jgi:hypothetical protein